VARGASKREMIVEFADSSVVVSNGYAKESRGASSATTSRPGI
jgi:hypothetical protein